MELCHLEIQNYYIIIIMQIACHAVVGCTVQCSLPVSSILEHVHSVCQPGVCSDMCYPNSMLLKWYLLVCGG